MNPLKKGAFIMKRLKEFLSAVLTVCVLMSVLAVPVAADLRESEQVVWKSSDYLDTERPVTDNNPWSVETTNNAQGQWETVKNTTATPSDTPLFPQMPDGKTPTTGYISTGDYTGVLWSINGVNAAVNGKYMIPGGQWHTGKDVNKNASAELAKVFTAPKSGTVRIDAASVMEGENGGMIVSVGTRKQSNTENWTEISGTAAVKKGNAELWKASFEKEVKKYKKTFNRVMVETVYTKVTAGEKIYFVYSPAKYWQRDKAAIMWDPIVEYIDTDTNRFKSSEYLDPERPETANNPWTFESKYSADGNWDRVTNTEETATTNDGYKLFPQMPDGVTPTKAYISSGTTDYSWSLHGANAAVCGKYMIPGYIYDSNDNRLKQCADNEIAKVFTAPKDGVIRIDAAATLDGAEGKLITWKKSAEDNSRNNTYSLTAGGETLWTADYSKTEHEENYDSIKFDTLYMEVKTGDKLYFIYDPMKYARRDSSALMWDPVVEYGKFNIVGDAIYNDGAVSVKFGLTSEDLGENVRIIAAVYKDKALMGCAMATPTEMADKTILVSGLTEKPDSVKIMTWDMGGNGEMKPVNDAVSKTVTEITAGE